MKTFARGCLALAASVILVSDLQAVEHKQPPNLLFILVDDLGWSDLSCFGSDFYETPHIDRLSKQSLKFSRAYAAAPVCSPTRAAIMTGKTPAALDMTIWHEGAVQGGPRNRRLLAAKATPNLPRSEITLAELFKRNGYVTAHVGKWHLGTAAYYPETQGFDTNIGGTYWGAPATFFYPFAGRWNQRDPEWRYVPGIGLGAQGEYLPDRLTDEALAIIENIHDRPFFLNLWYYTVHSPIEAPQHLINDYRKKVPGRRHQDVTYAAMVHRMDHNVGRLLQKLDDLKLRDNTIVVLTSDNGGVDFDQRSITPTSNAPLRSGKGTLYEGGLRVPLLIDWPHQPAGETMERVISQDFFPTFERLLSKGPTESRHNPTNGNNLMPLVRNPTIKLKPRTLYWHFPHYYPRMTPASAMLKGNWKLIHFYEQNRLELYDLDSDPGEESNLATMRTQLASQLYQDLDNWRKSVDANDPQPNLQWKAK